MERIYPTLILLFVSLACQGQYLDSTLDSIEFYDYNSENELELYELRTFELLTESLQEGKYYYYDSIGTQYLEIISLINYYEDGLVKNQRGNNINDELDDYNFYATYEYYSSGNLKKDCYEFQSLYNDQLNKGTSCREYSGLDPLENFTLLTWSSSSDDDPLEVSSQEDHRHVYQLENSNFILDSTFISEVNLEDGMRQLKEYKTFFYNELHQLVHQDYYVIRNGQFEIESNVSYEYNSQNLVSRNEYSHISDNNSFHAFDILYEQNGKVKEKIYYWREHEDVEWRITGRTIFHRSELINSIEENFSEPIDINWTNVESGVIRLQVQNLKVQSDYIFEIFDVLGNRVYAKKVDQVAELEANIELIPGSYFLSIRTNNQRQVEKILAF